MDLNWLRTYCARNKDEMNVLRTVCERNSIVLETFIYVAKITHSSPTPARFTIFTKRAKSQIITKFGECVS